MKKKTKDGNEESRGGFAGWAHCVGGLLPLLALLALTGCISPQGTDQFRLSLGVPRTATPGAGLTADPSTGSFCPHGAAIIPGSVQRIAIIPNEDGFLWADTRASQRDTILKIKRSASDIVCNDDISGTIVQSEICTYRVRKDFRYWVSVGTKAGTPNTGDLNVKLELKKTSCAITPVPAVVPR